LTLREELKGAQTALTEAREQLEGRDTRISQLSKSVEKHKMQASKNLLKYISACRQWRLDAGGLLHIARNAREVMENVALSQGELIDEGVASISKFFADMVGKLEGLNLHVVVRLEHEGEEIVEQVASAILSRVHYLAPDFLFHLLLDDFEDAEDRAAAEAAVTTLVDEVKEMMKQQ